MKFQTKERRFDNGKVKMDFSLSSTRVKNDFANEADPNFIMKRYQRTGQLPPCVTFNANRALYGDFTNGTDFTEMMNLVDRAKESFASLPAALKAKFGNDPGKFFAWFNDPANIEECVKFGVKDKSEIPVKELPQMNVQETVSPAPLESGVQGEQLA